MVQLCIFDLDGTLANTLRSIAGFANGALRRCGYGVIEPAEEYRFLVGNGADRLMRRMLDRVAGTYTEDEVKKLREVYDALYGADPLKDVTQYPDLLRVLQALKAAGVRLAVCSNKPDRDTRSVVEALFPQGLFDAYRGQRDGVPCKPAPDAPLLIARELGVKPEDCLYIGDSGVDMDTGRAAGMRTVGVLWGFRDKQELAGHGACAIISRPAELLPLAGVEERQ